MPRVNRVNKAAASKRPRICKCGQPIEPGQPYYWWKFRFGGKRYQHMACGYPRQSQLTQSAMGEIYAAQEAIEDLGTDASWEDKANALSELAEVAAQVRDQYQEAGEQFNYSGTNQERYEELDPWVSELEEAAEVVNEIASQIEQAEAAMEKAQECPV